MWYFGVFTRLAITFAHECVEEVLVDEWNSDYECVFVFDYFQQSKVIYLTIIRTMFVDLYKPYRSTSI